MSDSTTSAAVERGNNVVGDDRLFIGMDVHVRNSYLWVSDAAGNTVKRGRVGNTLGEIAQFLGPLEARPMRVVLESTTNTRAVCGLLISPHAVQEHTKMPLVQRVAQEQEVAPA